MRLENEGCQCQPNVSNRRELCVSNTEQFGSYEYRITTHISSMKSKTYLRGLTEFNRQVFFEAHETLEDVWRDASGSDRAFLQALIQTSVAFHHFTKGNVIGTSSLLEKSAHTLAKYADVFGGIDVLALRQSIAEWRQALDDGLAPPTFPKFQFCRIAKPSR
ncbi:MAG: hypothetical protein JWO91_2530 [Acidobacteriaceae bacterium]|jgi:hypothetical protein|nr:hypothetical protein [Acidobacteriaceae bacterium]